jgi:hypothetical protein
MDSSILQKQRSLPFQFLLTRLYFVCITPFFKYHMKILIFNDNLVCHISCVTLIQLLIRYLYIGRIEKDPFACKGRIIMSLPSCRFIFTSLNTRLCHSCNLPHTNALLKDIFKGEELSTSATIVYLTSNIWKGWVLWFQRLVTQPCVPRT